MLTIPQHQFTPFLPSDCEYIIGQMERGNETGYLHWQIMVSFKKKVTRRVVLKVFGNCHADLTKSAAADEYCFKEDTRVPNTQFQLGKKSLKRNSAKDWELIKNNAKQGKFDDVPPDVFIRYYASLKKIYVDSLQPVAQEKEVYVFYGRTGAGKSRRAWEEATLQAYPKSPTSIWWCGYSGQENVVIDEFRGQINISHLLRWCDRYPTIVEVKGSSIALSCRRIWITSNLAPHLWYPDLDQETQNALMRRFTLIQEFI